MTGSGKTAAFLLPILHHLIAKPRGKTRALVVTPTRELAAQILTALDSLAVHTPITAAAIYWYATVTLYFGLWLLIFIEK